MYLDCLKKEPIQQCGGIPLFMTPTHVSFYYISFLLPYAILN